MDQNIINTETTSIGTAQKYTKEKIIKRYGNRKLYDTEQSSYVVLKDIAAMIRNEKNIKVIDNETKEDITSTTLTQIIFSAEKRSSASAPLNILKSIIKKGDGSFSNFLAEMGLFKAQITDPKITIDNTNQNPLTAKKFYNTKVDRNTEYKTLQERVVRAALEPNENKNENPILPTSNNT